MQTSIKNTYDNSLDQDFSNNWYNIFNTSPIVRSYNNNLNLYNISNTRLNTRLISNTELISNTGPIVRSYNYVSKTGDDPFLHIFPYHNELYDNFITNLTNLYNLETYYLHNK